MSAMTQVLAAMLGGVMCLWLIGGLLMFIIGWLESEEKLRVYWCKNPHRLAFTILGGPIAWAIIFGVYAIGYANRK